MKRELAFVARIGGWTDDAHAVEGKGGDGKDVAALRRFSMVGYTGGKMNLAFWPHPVVVDLAGLRVTEKSRPILKDHRTDRIVGHTDSITVNDGQLLVAGTISGAGPVAREVIASSRNGFPWQASIGATVEAVDVVPKGRNAQVNGQEFTGPLHVVRKASLKEVSFVALGADDGTSARVAASRKDAGEDTMTFKEWLTARGFAIDDLDDTQRDSLEAAFRSEATGDESDAVTKVDGKVLDVDVAAGVDAGVAELRAEAARIADIQRICANKHSDIEARAIAEGWTAERIELEVLRAERPAANGVRTDNSTPFGGLAIEAALCLSAGLPEKQVAEGYDDRTMEAALSRDLRGAGLHTLLYESIRAVGGHVRPGRVDSEMIRAALDADQQVIRAASGAGSGFSTISLSGILSNVANKAMLAAYNAVTTAVPFFVSETDVSDFKTFTRYRLTGAGIFEEVSPGGELKHATLTEEAFTNQVKTYGRMISLTRQMIINDDLGAFLQIPRIIGRMSALKREEAVFTLLLSNPSSFFSAGNKNLITGATTNLQITSLTTAEQNFLDQTDSDGKPILIAPAVLLVPSSLKVVAQQLMTQTRVNETTASGKPAPADNPHAGKWEPVASPYLNAQGLVGSSATAWYLFANPADVAAMEIAYLRGKRVPTIESGAADFNTLGIQWRGYFDFGVAMQDHRAAVKSNGA